MTHLPTCLFVLASMHAQQCLIMVMLSAAAETRETVTPDCSQAQPAEQRTHTPAEHVAVAKALSDAPFWPLHTQPQAAAGALQAQAKLEAAGSFGSSSVGAAAV